MHQMGDSDYINEPQGSKNTDGRVRNKTGTTFLSPSIIYSRLKSEFLPIAIQTKIPDRYTVEQHVVVAGSG